jgi:predicted glycosyltransferase
VAFYCQHVLGIGHLVRSAEIIRALSHDSEVLFISGGERPDGFQFPEHENIEVLELPPLKTNPDFSNLHAASSSLSTDETKTLRRTMLLQSFARFKPDAIVTELFPFGRKHFRFELLPLLEHARQQSPRALVVSSVRDILVKRKDQEEFEQRACDLVNAFYDLILVHGDKNFQTLDQTFSRVNDLRCPVAYTGYVVRQSHAGKYRLPVAADGQPVIVASNGGGQYLTGQKLLESVLHAARLLRGSIPHEFQVFAGPLMPEEAYGRLQALASECPNVKLSRFTPDLGTLLRRAELSVNMAGYNTMMDVLSSGVRALVYPVTSNGDQEQIVRANSLAKAEVIDVISTQQLEPQELARKLKHALRKKPALLTLNFDGAANSANILKTFLNASRERPLELPATRRWPEAAEGTRARVSGSSTAEHRG